MCQRSAPRKGQFLFEEYPFLLEILVSMREKHASRALAARERSDSYELGIHLQLQWEVDEATTVHKAH